jgi:hypothetical protein
VLAGVKPRDRKDGHCRNKEEDEQHNVP